LKEKGYIYADEKGKVISYSAICKTCDGSTYIYTNNRDELFCRELYEIIKEFNDEYDCIEAIYNSSEAEEFGADPNCAFMLEAKKGYYFLDAMEGEPLREIQPGEAGRVPHVTLSTHGYSPDKPDYTTVFLASGKGIRKGIEIETMSLIDEGPTMARLLGLELMNADGKVLEALLDIEAANS
jgi:predicted AlkP superfamily pyrophosphatase or phosphodiesterase